MKLLIFLFYSTLSVPLIAQDRFTGKYDDNFGNSVNLRPDSTFRYEMRFDMVGSWTKGTWTARNDTIYFKMIPIYDTLKYVYKNGKSVDSLILSLDENPGQTTLLETLWIPSSGQNRYSYPEQLYFKHDKLYRIENGKLVKKKMKGIWTGKKYVPWFIKEQ